MHWLFRFSGNLKREMETSLHLSQISQMLSFSLTRNYSIWEAQIVVENRRCSQKAAENFDCSLGMSPIDLLS